MKLRILRNQEGASPGGGAAPPPAQQPTTPPAQGAAPLTRDDLKSFADDVRNGVFAELRRSGVLADKPKAKAAAKDDETPNGTTAQPAADPRRFDRTMVRLGIGPKLSERQMMALERDFLADNPSDPDAFIKQWASDFGIALEQPKPAGTAAAGAQQQGQGQAQQQTVTQPITARGAPPPSQVPVEEVNLWTCSQADRDAYANKHGASKYFERLREQGKNVKVKVRPD